MQPETSTRSPDAATASSPSPAAPAPGKVTRAQDGAAPALAAAAPAAPPPSSSSGGGGQRMGDWDAASMTGAMGMGEAAAPAGGGGDAGVPAGGAGGDVGGGRRAELPPGGVPPGGIPEGPDAPPPGDDGPQAQGFSAKTPYQLPSLEILPQQGWGKFWQVGGENIPVMAPTVVNVPKIGHVELEAGVRGGMNAGIEGYFGPGQLRNITIDLDTGPPPSAAEEVARAATWPVSAAVGPTPVGRFQGGAELYIPVDLLAHAGADAAIIGTATHAGTGAQVELTGLVAATGQFHWHTHAALPVQITAERSSLTAPWVFSFDAKKRLATSLKLACDLDAEARAKLQFDLDGPSKKKGAGAANACGADGDDVHADHWAPQDPWDPGKWNPLPPFNPGPPRSPVPDPGKGGGSSKVVVYWSRRWNLKTWRWETGWQFEADLSANAAGSRTATGSLVEDPSVKENLQPGELMRRMFLASKKEDKQSDSPVTAPGGPAGPGDPARPGGPDRDVPGGVPGGGGDAPVGVDPMMQAVLHSTADAARTAQEALEKKYAEEEQWLRGQELLAQSLKDEDEHKKKIADERAALRELEPQVRANHQLYLGTLRVASDPTMTSSSVNAFLTVKGEATQLESRLDALRGHRPDMIAEGQDEDLRTARAAFRRRLFSKRELMGAIGKSESTAGKYIQDWRAQRILFAKESDEFDPQKLFSFDARKAGERPLNDKESNRIKYGFVNPAKDSGVGMTILGKGLRQRPKDEDDLMNADWHKEKARYDSKRPGSAFRNFAWDDAILGHRHGASTYWNREGHRHPRSENLRWNRNPDNYWGPEHRIESDASGGSSERYRVPSAEAGSHESWLEE